MPDKRSTRVSLSFEEARHIVGALRDRIDGYDEQLQEASGGDEEREWLEEALATLRPLERRLTKRFSLVDPT